MGWVFLERFHHKKANFTLNQACNMVDVCIQEEYTTCTAACWAFKEIPSPCPFSGRDKQGMLPSGLQTSNYLSPVPSAFACFRQTLKELVIFLRSDAKRANFSA